MNIVRNYSYFLSILLGIDKKRFFLTLINDTISFILWIFYSIYFVSYLFSDVGHGRNFEKNAEFICLCAIFSFVCILFKVWFERYYCLISDEMIKGTLNKMLFEKVLKTDISYFENSLYYDSYTKAISESSLRAVSIIESLSKLLLSFLSTIYVISVMASITLLVIPLIIVPLISIVYFSKKIGQLHFLLHEKTIPQLRKLEYIDRIIYLREYSSEVRITRVFSLIMKYLKENLQVLIEEYNRFSYKKFLYYSAQNILIYPLSFIGMWTLGAYLALYKKSIEVEDFLILSTSIVSLTWILNDFAVSAEKFFSNGEFIVNLKNFLSFKSQIDDVENKPYLKLPDQITKIEFKNVYFKYPQEKSYILENISFTMDDQSMNALIGTNGSGKSTIIKLLLRLYDPTRGSIFINEVDIKRFNVKEYREKIGITFQDFSLFASNVFENVLLKDNLSTQDIDDAERALRISGVADKINQLHEKGYSMLTKEFDEHGYELSGGEKQKVATSRAFLNNHSLIILDEPTASLDPISEERFFDNIIDYFNSKSCISIIITHRLSLAKKCDSIFLIENGKLIESGTHETLYSYESKYRKLFNDQKDSYKYEE